MNMTFNMTYMIFTAEPEGLICILFYFLLMKYIPRRTQKKDISTTRKKSMDI